MDGFVIGDVILGFFSGLVFDEDYRVKQSEQCGLLYILRI